MESSMSNREQVSVPLPRELRMPYATAEPREKFRLASENPDKVELVRQILARHPGEPALVISNHTDQEEVYIFLHGHGSMEVYESPETLSFVHNVKKGDMVTIPFLNYHPVFSQEDPLLFIWCMAGARHGVGDQRRTF